MVDVDQNGNVTTQSTLAALNVQVRSIERDYTDLRSAVVNLDHKLEAGLNTISTQLASQLSSINGKIEERGRPQWHALGVILAAFVAFVGFAYWPIHAAQEDTHNKVETILGMLPEKYVNYREHERLISQINEYRRDIDQHWIGIRDREEATRKQLDELASFSARK